MTLVINVSLFALNIILREQMIKINVPINDKIKEIK